MTEPDTRIEAALRDLGANLEVPEPPALGVLTDAVRARLAGPPSRARRPLFGGPVLPRVAAVILVVLLAGAVLITVSPPVRAGVLNLLRFAGIEFSSESAPVPSGLPTAAPLPGERSVDLATARRLSAFPVLAPAGLGEPERVLVADGDPPRVVSLVYRGGQIRLDQFDGELDLAFLKKSVGRGGMEWAEVNGESAVWVDRPHEVVYVDRDGGHHTESARLSGRTLIWQDGDVTLRLEGDLTVLEALEIARSVR